MNDNDDFKSKILIIDSTLTISDFESFLNSFEIITLDYASHMTLIDKGISHTNSDDFLGSHEIQDLENQIYHLVNWYNLKEISKIITDNGINLGELFYVEFRSELTQFLKKYLEISKIFLKYSNFSFLSSQNVSEIISTFSNNFSIIETTKKIESIYSTVDIPIKFGKKNFTLKLNLTTVSRIKSILEKSTKSFINKKIQNNMKTVLLVGFTTLKNKNFLLSSTNYDLNLVKYDSVLPSIWNKETFDIIKTSKCIVENQSTILNNEVKDLIKEKQNIFEKKIDSLLLNENILSKHFSINNQSFWKSLKPLFIRMCQKHFFNAAQEIIQGEKLFKKYSFSKILLFNEAEMIEQIILSLAKNNNISIYLIQHGVYYDTDEMMMENKFGRIIPQKSDFFITWGEIFKNYLIKNSISQDKIKNLGSLFFDKLQLENNLSGMSNQILLASDPLAFNRPIDLTISQKDLYQNTIEHICKIVSQKNKKLIIKTHPQKNQNEQEIAKKIDQTILVYHSGDIYPLIESSDLVIVTDVTTVILEAMIMQKPVISIRMKEHYGKPEIFNYCKQIPIGSLDSFIKSFYSSSKIKNDLIDKGNDFLKIYLQNQGCASQELLKFLQRK